MFNKHEDNFFNEQKQSDQATESLLHLIDNYDKKITIDLKPGCKVDGKITKIGNEYIFVDIGSKNEAIIKKVELVEGNIDIQLKIGDTISAFVISNSDYETILSKRLSDNHAELNELYNAYNNQIPVMGKVTGVSKDGLNVKILGHRTFCPISQIDTKFTDDVNFFLNKTFEFIITRISENGKNIIVSRIPLLEKVLSNIIDTLEKSLQNKSIVHGEISKITDFGLFINLGGIDGLIHISEISWEHQDKITDKFSLGQKVDCIVIQIIRKKPLKNTKISLSIKLLTENPWLNINSRLSCGQTIPGKVLKITNFGAFIEILPGIIGLAHISELSWIKNIRHPSEILTIGSLVNATILSIDESKKTLSLSLKDIANDPWKNIYERFPIGFQVTGIIAKKSRYGYFIDLEQGITGLLVFSNISNEKKDTFKEGEPIEVIIESIDLNNRRISLSQKINEDTINNKAALQFLDKNRQLKNENISTEFGEALLAAIKNRKL